MKIIDKEDELLDAFKILDIEGTGKISKYQLTDEGGLLRSGFECIGSGVWN